MQRSILLIIIIFVISLYISVPKEVPLNVTLFGRTLEWKFIRHDLDISVGKFSLKKNFDLKLGLDLAGGSHLVYEARLDKVDSQRIEEAMQSLREVMERRVNLFGVSEPNVYTSSFGGKQRIVVELPGVTDTKEAIKTIGKTAQLVFAEVGVDEKQPIKPTDLTGADFKRAKVVYDQNTGKPAVSIEFTDEGAKKFAELTERNVGKNLPILLDDVPISAPVVQEKIVGGSAQISGNFSFEEAKNLAIQLNAGALPVDVDLIEQRTVGATLGAESVQKSIRAGIVGVVMVLLFMILNYGKMGLIADLALFVFAAVTLAIYKLIPVVLTLPGIAGFLLSVGMAVDSNILIFERFKEERRQRNLMNALEVAFGRAWDSIRDANIATFVTAFVLANPLDFSFLNTSGPVRGFAITLALGVAVSLFTGIFVSRNLLRFMLIQVNKK